MTRLQIVVEGHGEREASSLLVRRVLEAAGEYGIEVLKPQRRRDIVSLLSKDGADLLRFQRVAECQSDRVLWILDHDDGCALESLAAVYGILSQHGVLCPTGFCFLVREFETLFLEAPDCCEDYYGVPAAHFAAGSHSRDAKGHISAMLPTGSSYKPTTDQVRLTARLDLDALARQSRSFQHLQRVLNWLCQDVVHGLYPGQN